VGKVVACRRRISAESMTIFLPSADEFRASIGVGRVREAARIVLFDAAIDFG
jgi:hypothetical protein